MSYQLKNAFDKLFDDLMEDKTREMEPAEVSRDRKNTAVFFTVDLIHPSDLQMSVLMSTRTGSVHSSAPTSKASALMDDLS